MFWKLGFHNQKAPLTTLLEKEDVKLEEVLDQDDVLQEVKSGNDKLVCFLSQPDCVRKLIQFTTETVNGEDADDKRRFKFPYLACEILVAEIPAIDSALVESEEHLKLLLDFLTQPAPLPQSLSLYFVRVLQTLYTKKPQEVIQFILGKDREFALHFIRHIDTFGMNELILTLLGTMDEENRHQDGCSVSDWWMGHDFVPELLQRLTAEHSADVHINIIRMLCELVRRFNNPNIAHLADSLMAATAARQLMGLMLAHLRLDSRSIVFTEGTNLVISIIDSLVRKEDACRQMKEKLQQLDCTADPEALAAELDETVNLTFRTLLEWVPELVAFLKQPGPLEPMYLTWGALNPPLGLARLKTVELLLVMMKTKKRYIDEAVIALDLVNICLDLFFEYDMNNLLHILVDEIVTSCLVSENDALVRCLFQDCHILPRILVTVKEDGEGCGGRPLAMRKGYFGHVTSMSNKVCQAEDHQPLVKAYTQDREWREYVTGALAARNAADTTVLGGVVAAGDDPMETMYAYTSAQEYTGVPDPEEVEILHVPESPPQKYALPSSVPDPDGLEAAPGEATQSVDLRDADFDARGAFLDDDPFPLPAPEEVWQERQIVDNSSPPAAESGDWGRFEDGGADAPPPPKPAFVFYDVDEDSSSDEENQHFVPSPTQASGAPSLSLPGISPPVTACPRAADPHRGGGQEDGALYSDFQFWRPNWEDITDGPA